MGRFYNGDIEGKFWVAIQSSDDASFFGGSENQPNYINYSFNEEDDLDTIKDGIKKCEVELGEYKEKIDEFFEKNNGYNDIKVAKALETDETKARELLVWYARLELGTKILKCVEKQGSCLFEAEL